MPKPEDLETARMVRKEFARRPIDTSLMTISIVHGVVYLRGSVKPMRGHTFDMKEELEILSKILRQRPGIRDVVIDVTRRS